MVIITAVLDNMAAVVVAQPLHTLQAVALEDKVIQAVLTNTIGPVEAVAALASLGRIIKVDLEPAVQSQVLV